MNELKIISKRKELIVRYLISVIIFGVLFEYIIFDSFNDFSPIDVLPIGAFIYCIWVVFKRAFVDLSRKHLLILNDEGLVDYSYGLGFIPWNNIASVERIEVVRVFNYELLKLTLKDPGKYFEGKWKWGKWLLKIGYKSKSKNVGFWINTWKLKLDRDEILNEIEIRIKSYS